MDAHFYHKKNIGLLCEYCGRGMKRHKKIKGEGNFKGWTRYQCKDGGKSSQFIIKRGENPPAPPVRLLGE
jgi:hypothetical protein